MCSQVQTEREITISSVLTQLMAFPSGLGLPALRLSCLKSVEVEKFGFKTPNGLNVFPLVVQSRERAIRSQFACTYEDEELPLNRVLDFPSTSQVPSCVHPAPKPRHAAGRTFTPQTYSPQPAGSTASFTLASALFQRLQPSLESDGPPLPGRGVEMPRAPLQVWAAQTQLTLRCRARLTRGSRWTRTNMGDRRTSLLERNVPRVPQLKFLLGASAGRS